MNAKRLKSINDSRSHRMCFYLSLFLFLFNYLLSYCVRGKRQGTCICVAQVPATVRAWTEIEFPRLIFEEFLRSIYYWNSSLNIQYIGCTRVSMAQVTDRQTDTQYFLRTEPHEEWLQFVAASWKKKYYAKDIRCETNKSQFLNFIFLFFCESIAIQEPHASCVPHTHGEKLNKINN